jgi:ABC-2 type transport system permease protein
MKKYLSFFKIRFINGLQYRAAAWAGVATQFVWGFFTLLMFRAFYKSGQNVFPMSFSQLSNYIWLTAFFMLLYISAFYTLSPTGIRILATSVIEFFAGAIIPLPFFPSELLPVINALPFASMQNTPFLIYNGFISGSDIIRSILLQLGWLVILVALGKMLMNRALKKVIVQGG